MGAPVNIRKERERQKGLAEAWVRRNSCDTSAGGSTEAASGDGIHSASIRGQIVGNESCDQGRAGQEVSGVAEAQGSRGEVGETDTSAAKLSGTVCGPESSSPDEGDSQ